MGLKNKAYMEGRAKLLEAGGKVVRQKTGAPAAGGFNKWNAKPNNAGFNDGNDFVEEPKKKRQKTEWYWERSWLNSQWLIILKHKLSSITQTITLTILTVSYFTSFLSIQGIHEDS